MREPTITSADLLASMRSASATSDAETLRGYLGTEQQPETAS